MLTWDELVALCQDQIDNVAPRLFERALKDLAEPDFARATKCIDAEKTYDTVVGTPDYEMPLGVVNIKEVTWRGVPLRETSVANLGYQERYNSSGNLQAGTPWKYFLENDRIHLVPAPSSVETLRISYFTLPSYAKKRYRALGGTTTTVVYLDLGIGEDLKNKEFFNVTRDATESCSDYVLDGNRHKYTLASAIPGQVAGDEIEIDVHQYVPMIPEIYSERLIPRALAVGYASVGDTAQRDYWMAEYVRMRDEVVGERDARGYPEQVLNDWEGIS